MSNAFSQVISHESEESAIVTLAPSGGLNNEKYGLGGTFTFC